MSRRDRDKSPRSSAVGAEDALETLVNQFADPLVFLRELVQNSLDAAATRIDVDFEHDRKRALATITIADNGEGMNEGIIDRYLLTLFRSTKENDLTKIGKFGVGFVSIFAIAPDLVVLDTGQAGESWRILFHADRRFEKLRLGEPVEGTTIALHKSMTRAEFVDIRQRAENTVRYWCKYAEAEIYVDGEPTAENFGIDAALALHHREPGTEMAVGFALPKSVVDTERRHLAGAEAASALAPVVGFYNRGLTLIEASEPPGDESGHFMAGLSARVKSRYLEHTLTRDNVRQDENYAKAMSQLRKQVDARLRPALIEHLCALANHRSKGTELPTVVASGPDLELALLYARLPSMRLHETAERAPILPTLTGEPISIRTLRSTRWPTGMPLCASVASPVTAILAVRGLPVLLDDPVVRAHLEALAIVARTPTQTDRAPDSGGDGGGDSSDKSKYLADANRALVTAARVQVEAPGTACLSRVADLLERARIKLARVDAGDLAYPGSPVGKELYLRQEKAFELTRPGIDDQPSWIGGARDIVVNVSHPLIASALRLAASDPALGAQIIAQAICIREQADQRRAVELAHTAMNWRRAR